MSKSSPIRIDEEDLVKIRQNLSANLIQVKQGIINPSFMVMIVPTKEPDVFLKPIIKEEDGVAKIVGQEEIKKLSDLMSSDVKRLN